MEGLGAGTGRPRWSRRQESNLYFTLRRHAHYPLCYGEGWSILGCAPRVEGARVLWGGCLALMGG